MGKNIHLANVKILIWKVVDDGSSRSEVGMQIAISHEVCAVSRSCFFYHGKSWNGKRYPFFKSEILTSDMETSCWWQQQGWCRNANCCFSWSVSSKQKLFLLLWQKLKWEKNPSCKWGKNWHLIWKLFATGTSSVCIWIFFAISIFAMIEETSLKEKGDILQ